MAENDPNQAFAVEGMGEQEFTNYVARRQASVGLLPLTMEFYQAKKTTLEQAVKAERDAVEILRCVSRLTVTAGAANQDLTVEKRNELLIRLRQAVIATRQHFVFVNSKFFLCILSNNLRHLLNLATVSSGWDIAYEVLGGGGSNEDLLSPDQRKLLEAAKKRKRDEEANMAATRRPSTSFLPIAMAGGKRLRRDRTNSPCHLCG